jgi:hypothetical protein
MIDPRSTLHRMLRVPMWPGRFKPQPPSKFESNLVTYAPPQLLVFFAFGLFAPGALLEYWFFRGHIIGVSFAALVWVPLLWLFLIEVHHMGRVRFWLSAPIMSTGHVLIALWFAGLV